MGFTELGDNENFPTEALEQRLARSGESELVVGLDSIPPCASKLHPVDIGCVVPLYAEQEGEFYGYRRILFLNDSIQEISRFLNNSINK